MKKTKRLKKATKTVAEFVSLTKPGIIRGNLITAAAGFLLASGGWVEWFDLLWLLAGVMLVIASACVFNNILDRKIDRKMNRTQNRALAANKISVQTAMVFGSILGLVGFTLLGVFANVLVLVLGLLAVFSYVIFYGYVKRVSIHGTLVGTIPGALPLVAGYCAVTGRITSGAVMLFVIMVFWQMAHFYAIAIFRRQEYAAAGLPVYAVKKGVAATKFWIFIYIILFIASLSGLAALGYAGKTYLVVTSLAGFYWLAVALKGFGATDDAKWARSVFSSSLLVLLIFSIMISVDSFLP